MDFTQLKVLVVDDIKVVRTALSRDLTSIGIHKIHESDNIMDAWEKIISENVDLIFCDWNMPNGDGIELLKRVRAEKDDSLRFKKFIMITGSEGKAYMAMDSGAHNIIHKPFKSEDIKNKIELLFS